MDETQREAAERLGAWDRQRSATLVLAAVVFTYVFLANSWVCDDAYITFRVSDNLVHGFGLRWNVAERVQVFTNPLWMLVMAGAAWFTGEFFYTALFISLSCCLAAVGVAIVSLKNPARAWLLLALLLSSKAFVDYSSSGLEYPLSYLLLAVFVVLSRPDNESAGGRAGGRFAVLTTVASLGFVNRADTVLLFAPTLAWLGLARARRLNWRTAGIVLIASAPAWGWLAFALVYFGFLFPNPYYAKVATGIPHWLQVRQGLAYAANSLHFDPVTLPAVAVAIGLAWTTGTARARALTLGAAAYTAYAIWVGGDFMSGRLFALPFLSAAIVVAESAEPGRAALAGVTALLALNLVNPLAPVKSGPFYEMGWPWRLQNGIKDERGGYHRSTDLLLFAPFTALPDHQWVREGISLRSSGEKVFVRPSVGFIGFYAGPAKYIIDANALTDPLLARLPVGDDLYFNFWTSHYSRPIPEGYVESRRVGKNLLTDPLIRDYFGRILLVTTGPVFSLNRASAIWELNWGKYRGFHRTVSEARTFDVRARVGQPPFKSDVGEVDRDQFLRTTGKTGYLLIGPGTPLQAGNYRVTWTGTSGDPAGPLEGGAEVCVDGCRRWIARVPISAPGVEDGVVGDVTFQLARDADDIEFRVFVGKGVSLRLQEVRLVRQQ